MVNAINILRGVFGICPLLLVLCCCNNQCDEIEIQDGYFLVRWDAGSVYYLTLGSCSVERGGVVEGVITNIGWNDSIIVVKKVPLASIDTVGWMIVDTKENIGEGPYSDEEFRKINSRILIEVYKPHHAWDVLISARTIEN